MNHNGTQIKIAKNPNRLRYTQYRVDAEIKSNHGFESTSYHTWATDDDDAIMLENKRKIVEEKILSQNKVI